MAGVERALTPPPFGPLSNLSVYSGVSSLEAEGPFIAVPCPGAEASKWREDGN